MATQECGNCSAPLELGPVGSVARCRFCGTDNRIRPADGQPVQPVGTASASAGSPRQRGAPFSPVVLAIVGGLLMLGFAIASMAFLSSAPTATPSAEAVDPRVPPEALSTTEERSVELEPPPGLEGSLTSFPLADNHEWVLGIAKAWKPDARFRHLQAEDVEPERTNATDVNYAFISPSAVTDYRARAETEDPEVNDRLVILVEDGRLRATRLFGRPDDDLPPERFDACPLKEALNAALEQGNLPRRPHYRVSGGFDNQDRPFWQINATASDTSVQIGPDCAPR